MRRKHRQENTGLLLEGVDWLKGVLGDIPKS